MALDAQMTGILAALNARGLPDMSRITATEFRAAANDKRMARALEPVHSIEDRQIPGPAAAIALRIYHPEAAEALPLLVYFHGGGFVLGAIDSHDNLCRALANALPAVVISVDYRLAPEHKYPAAADDAYAATLWAAAHASELGADPARLLVGGDSAGGNLAAVVSLRARDQGGPAIAHQLLLYPVCDNDLERASYQRIGKGYFIDAEMMGWFWKQYLNSPADADQAYACPLKAESLIGLPSATVLTAEYDPLCDEGEAYAARLAEAGVATHYLHVPGAIHGFLSFLGAADLSDRTLLATVEAVNAAMAQPA
ncbi:alpha/beta hydrolase [Pseudomonas lopnurensis]|uniref:alpha/beta hydrolase n=1 Tax=Pseudomonas lopnurensis TaxID=1477517 RepID=UPI0028B1911F|nr:alpha/beta hydrolase [Pseudomonas lopnurensis]